MYMTPFVPDYDVRRESKTLLKFGISTRPLLPNANYRQLLPTYVATFLLGERSNKQNELLKKPLMIAPWLVVSLELTHRLSQCGVDSIVAS